MLVYQRVPFIYGDLSLPEAIIQQHLGGPRVRLLLVFSPIIWPQKKTGSHQKVSMFFNPHQQYRFNIGSIKHV